MKRFILFLLLSLSISTYSQIPSYIPANGLVGWWPFNGNANDESGNGNNGSVNGATLTSDRNGVVNSAYDFNGSSILIPLTQQMVLMPSRTISLWFNSAQAQTGGRLFEATNYSWGIGCYNSTSFDCWYQKSNQAYNFVGESFGSHNTWHHLIFICDSVNQQKSIYLNGIQLNVGNPVSNPGAPVDWLNHYLKIGLGNANESFIGAIDDIGLWDRALNTCEIQQLFTSQLQYANTINAGQDLSVCRGSEVALYGTGGNFLSWNNGVVNGVPFVPNQTSDYILTGSDSLGCMGSDTVLVTILENSTIIIDQTAIDSFTLNGQTYTQSGTYTQVLTAANGCDSIITINLELDFTGINSNVTDKFILQPNPNIGLFKIHIPNQYLGQTINVLSLDGSSLQSFLALSGDQLIDIRQLSSGYYLLKVGQELPIPFIKN